ncbi:MAG: aminotransferase class I/II-fold pyridoxal phosphate-dependent enzyme [Candidatus Bathyarchaeia archaeon]
MVLKFPPFMLERWLSESRFECDIDLSASVITHLRYNELISEKDLDAPIRIGPTNGTEELRQEISALYSGVVEADGVLVTHGAAEANFLLLNYLVAPGDECVFLVPNYMQAKGILEAIGARVRLSWLDEKKNYRPNIEEINELTSKKTKAILITNPNNPTGARLTLKELEAICDIARSVNAYVIGDEVLCGLEIDGKITKSPVEIYEKGVSTRSVSKLGLSGLRVGWIASRDPTIAQKCWSFRDYTSLGNSFFNQHVAAVALKKLDWIRERNRKILSHRVEILMKAVEENKDIISCVKPQAGSTALIRYNHSINSVEYCKKLAEKEKVAVSPGDYFEVPQRFRILYGTDAEKLKNGLQKIIRFTRSLA